MTIAVDEPSSNEKLDKCTPVISSDARPVDQIIQETVSEAQEALDDPYRFGQPIRRVAIIGGGPSGLSAAKALLEQGFDIQVFERHRKVGGNWLLSEPVQDLIHIPAATEKDGDWLQYDKDAIAATGGQLPSCVRSSSPVKCTDEVSHWIRNYHQPPSACYWDLNNNTSTPVLGSYEFPWPKDTPYFVHHSKIQQYYEDYVDHFGLRKYIQFNTSLDALEKLDNKWELTLTRATKEPNGVEISVNRYQSTFDAVVIATGLFQDATVPCMDGLPAFASRFPGRVMHSKQFKRSDQFKNKNVLVVGGRVSAVDVSRLVSISAKQVYLSYRGPFITNIFLADLIRTAIPDNVIHKPAIEGFWAKDTETGEKAVNGAITFTDGSTLDSIDVVIFATGYKTKHSYFGASRMWIQEDKNGDHFVPSKDDAPLLVMNDKKVHNTYKDIFLISDPTVAFVGAPRHITTTPFFDYQAQTIGRVWSEHAFLPSQSKMKTFSLAQKPVCPPYRMDYEAERLKPQILLPWLNLHAEKLVPDLRLPILEGPSDSLASIWKESIGIWKESVKRQQMEMALAQQGGMVG